MGYLGVTLGPIGVQRAQYPLSKENQGPLNLRYIPYLRGIGLSGFLLSERSANVHANIAGVHHARVTYDSDWSLEVCKIRPCSGAQCG